ncbi:hypothetical protein [Sphingobium sp. B2]|uniref:hypothetical protein n=1 Tax=Sphingobium sp. B2 TaxID=2583228 RepID=UPI0016438FA0|nr:hypothetical protein [Sphingobium sp. B2]
MSLQIMMVQASPGHEHRVPRRAGQERSERGGSHAATGRVDAGGKGRSVAEGGG